MDFGKHGSSDSSSDEYVETTTDNHDHDDPTKRPYECTFCKRGFTNAQALGGHMNIHRKDRAKAKVNVKVKQRTSFINSGFHFSNSNSHYNNNNINNDTHYMENPCASKYFAPVSTQPQPSESRPSPSPPAPPYYPGPHYEAATHRRSNYRMYFEQSTATTTRPTAAGYYPIHQPRIPQSSSNLNMNEELLAANLSLQIDQTRTVWKNEEVDLELRLGHEYR